MNGRKVFTRWSIVVVITCLMLLAPTSNALALAGTDTGLTGSDTAGYGYKTDRDKNNGDDNRGPTPQRADMVPGRLIVKFKSGVQVATGASKTGRTAVDFVMSRFAVTGIEKAFSRIENMPASKRATLKGLDRLQHIYKVDFDPSKDPRLMAGLLSRLPEVAYAEPIYLNHTTQISTSPAWFDQEPAAGSMMAGNMMEAPNDPRFNEQVYFDRFFVQDAWDVVKGETGDVVVAILDGGTDWTHEDMQANLWVNPGEEAGDGLDNDLNGYVDDVNGWNFANDSGDPKGLTNTPSNARHGTQTAGLIGAQSNNGIGIAGTSWNATYMPINISCDDVINGQESLCYAFEGYEYAMVNGADILNASYGSAFRSNAVQDVIDTLHENGVLIIAAAGNNNRNNNDIAPYYPASYNHVLSVGATSRNGDGLTSFTHVGVSVDIFAPGTAILSTSPFNGYLTNTGTSFSAPMVAGVAAMVKTQHPTWGPDQVREQVRATADDITGVNSAFINKMGKGRVNALRAVTETTPSIRVVSTDLRDPSGSSRIDAGERATVTMEVTNFLETATDISITLESDAPGLTFPQPSASIASLLPGDTTTVEFQLQPTFDVAQNLESTIVAQITANDGYTDIDAFSALINSTSHDTGNIQMTLTDEGNIGYEGFKDESPGIGFRYLDFDFLFEGGLVTGNGINTISDNIRGEGTEQDDDFVKVNGSDFGIIDGRVTNEEGALELVDSAADTPLEIQVRLDSYADTSAAYRDFVVLKYTIENTGSESITDYHAGLFFDWDSFDDPFTDHARYDASRSMGYFLNDTPEMADVFLATKLLTDASVNFRAIDNPTEIWSNTGATDPNDGFTNTEKWEFISGGVQTQSLDETDISVILAAGPYDIPAGENIEVAFALVGGTSLEEIQTNADAAQELWNTTLSTLGPNPVANEGFGTPPALTFGLQEPYPNPVRGTATVDFELAAPGEVQIRVYDVLGREVRTLLDATRPAGKHSLTWDSTDNTGTPLASGLYMISLTAPSTDGLKSASKKVVVLR